MGCHTWFYRKIERTQEQAKQNCLKGLLKSEKLNLSILNDRNYNGIDWSEWTDDMLLNQDATLKRQIRMVENNFCQRAIWNYQDDENLTEYIDGKGLYIGYTGFHDVFRRGGYPEDRLFSYEETIKYLEDNDSIIRYGYFQRSHPGIPCINGLCNGEKPIWFEVDREIRKLEVLELLKEFWNKYPDGMIEFG